jgi:hypothetical protein
LQVWIEASIWQSFLFPLCRSCVLSQRFRLVHTPDDQVVTGPRYGNARITGNLLQEPAFLPGEESDDALIAYLLAG